MSWERLTVARAALARGDVLIAYDEAAAALVDNSENLDAGYVAALALARSGALHGAVIAAEELQTRLSSADAAPHRLREDIDALLARIAKATALEATGVARRSLLALAARRYEDVADRYGGFYATVNAATLRLLADEPVAARELAHRALDLVAADTGSDRESEYWCSATIAEAALVLGDVDAARDALGRAAILGAGDLASQAATRNQLRLVCAVMKVSTEVLDALSPPVVLHYCGHRAAIASSTTGSRVAADVDLRPAVDEILGDQRSVIAFGSLASGADIIIAEAVLARGGELHVVLPFSTAEFESTSVADGGANWIERFRSCLRAAASVTHASDSDYVGNDELFVYALHMAMGHAINRARVLGVEACQLAAWDGLPARGRGGTAEAIEDWQRTGWSQHVVAVPPRPAAGSRSAADAGRTSAPRMDRSVRAILFGDLHGVSRLRDEQFPIMIDELFARFAHVLDGFGVRVLGRNTWGDALQVIFRDVVAAGHAALALQAVMSAVDLSSYGLPDDLGLRVSAHVGPVVYRRDPVRSIPGWWGREITRAAHIEPRTPEGQVYATDAFAALLALEPESGLATEYVGRVTTAKNFETIPMYRIWRRKSAELA